MTETEVSLRELVEQARQELKPDLVGRTIQWEIGDLPRVQGDLTLLQSVLVNLLSNAIKYTRFRNSARIEIGSREDAQAGSNRLCAQTAH